MRGNNVDPSHQIVQTGKLMGVGKGARIPGKDFFLSRPACYLIAMNGDPAKPEIAAALTLPEDLSFEDWCEGLNPSVAPSYPVE